MNVNKALSSHCFYCNDDAKYLIAFEIHDGTRPERSVCEWHRDVQRDMCEKSGDWFAWAALKGSNVNVDVVEAIANEMNEVAESGARMLELIPTKARNEAFAYVITGMIAGGESQFVAMESVAYSLDTSVRSMQESNVKRVAHRVMARLTNSIAWLEAAVRNNYETNAWLVDAIEYATIVRFLIEKGPRVNLVRENWEGKNTASRKCQACTHYKRNRIAKRRVEFDGYDREYCMRCFRAIKKADPALFETVNVVRIQGGSMYNQNPKMEFFPEFPEPNGFDEQLDAHLDAEYVKTEPIDLVRVTPKRSQLKCECCRNDNKRVRATHKIEYRDYYYAHRSQHVCGYHLNVLTTCGLRVIDWGFIG